MTLERVLISGPPPPARLDHAMCAVHLVTTSATARGQTEKKPALISTNTGTVIHSKRVNLSMVYFLQCILAKHAYPELCNLICSCVKGGTMYV